MSSTLASLTRKLACPAESVVPETVAIVELPGPWSSEIALPATGWPEASFSVTVIVDVVELSATRLVGLAVTVETDAEAGPTPKFNAF